MADSITVNELPTAGESPESWNVLWIAGQPCPGTCLPIEGERKRAVDHTKSKGSSRDLLVDQGLEPTECTIRIRTTNGEVFRALHEFYLKYMDPSRALTRLNVVTVEHPQLYASGIKMGYFFSAPLPKPTADSGIRPYISEFRFKVVGPKTQISANSGSTKPGQSVQIGGPTDPVFKARSGVNAAVTAIGNAAKLLPGVSLFTGAAPKPAPQPATVLSPADLNKVANTGDTTAKFVSNLFGSAAP